MKRFFLFFLASVILVGCSDDPSLILAEALKREAREKQEQSVQPGIEFRSEFDAAPVVPGESAETPVYFKSNLEWKAETTSSWFSISPKSGKSGDGSVVIKTQANEEFDTRSGKITFTSGYKTFTITVVQSPKSAIILEKDSFEVGKDGGTVTVVAKTTVGFETVVPSDYLGWIGVEPYTKALKTRYVQLNIAKNDGPERTGYVDLVNKEKGLSKRVSIKQEAGGIEVTGVSLDKTELTITVGDPGVKLVATVTPDNATDKTVSWSSDNEAVATVDNQGNVHAEAPGTATITVTTTDGGKTATCAVTVKTPVTTFKAVYDTNGGANTLTFYYDANDHSGEGIAVYDNLPTAATMATDWGYNDKRGEIKSVVIDASVAGYQGLTSTASMFQGMDKATNISGAEYLDVSNVTNMNSMFESYGESSNNLNKVPDVSGWKTGKVTSMTSMFNNYGNNSTVLADVPDVSNWNTVNVTDMADMFQNYGYSSTALSTVPDVSKWNTGKVTSMTSMFNNYGNNSTVLADVPDVSNWNTGKVTDMADMFQNYGYSSTSLSTVPNVSGWNTSNVTKISNLFNDYGHTSNNIDCTLDLSGWDLSKITGNNGENVFNFNPSTFNITIPAKTGDKLNEGGVWYYGDGTNSIAPPTGKTFTPLPAGALKGVFTVSDPDGTPNSGDEKKVRFSQGNLQATYNSSTSTYTWGFAPNQYDYIGNAAGNTTIDSQTNGAVVDLFGWSTDAASNNWGIHTRDASTYTTGNFKDWGEAIDNKGTWRTLSGGPGSEWGYLCDNHVHVYGTCNNVPGVFIAPDGFVGDASALSEAIKDWESALATGILFLPAAGYRYGSEVDSVSGDAYYWSSTLYNNGNAFCLSFYFNGIFAPSTVLERCIGSSVRLVTEVPAAGSTIEDFNKKNDDPGNWN